MVNWLQDVMLGRLADDQDLDIEIRFVGQMGCAHQTVVLCIIDAGEACYACATEVDGTSVAQVVDVGSSPASMVKLPQVI